MTMAHLAAAPPVVTPLHRAAPECKILAFAGFVLAVALVPHGRALPYAVDAALLLVLAAWARVGPGFLGRRLVLEVPFIAFVVLLPFVTGGTTTDVLGVTVSEDGLWAAFGIAAKATLAVLAAGVLAATTTGPELLAGMERLRVPRTMIAVAGFALRYVQVVLEELRALQLARVARGDDPRWLWQIRAVARTAGALAIRCFERGERVHTAMLARGFEGRMPTLGLTAAATPLAWLAAAALVLPAAVVTATA